ncbi:MAG: SusC/RagA family TonB-linked outer membrane protein [Cyclobacteriaceae bacterium]|nr:MAG: SusC/RagA family TonB-linked outer membrane protein [Cyclobacteriaceae bacterium]
MLGSTGLWAQQVVTGRVIDETGEGLPGVNILVTGTSTGTVSDGDGNYSIEVPEGGSLSYSFIGYLDQRLEVGDRSVVNLALEPDVQQLGEVVVTALGVERETRALQSSVTQIDGENFVKARENSLANALAGRVAGVNVTKIASGPAASSRVVIRGAKTLGSNLNQPLYVVDGVPMTNINNGQAGLWGGADQGDGMSSLNPDDIESTTVLKGASAAALYGSRAANGVILITTKKGSRRNGIGIEFNSNYVFDKVNDLRDEIQQTHGYGGFSGPDLATQVAEKPVDPNDPTDWSNATGWWNNTGWGPRFDGSPVLHWDGKVREYSHQGDNFKRWFETGSTWTNSLAFTGGNSDQNFRFSVADLRSDGIVPNSGFDRFNATLSTNSKFGDKVTLSANMMYSNEEAKNRPDLSDSPGNGILAMYYLPNDQNVDWLRGDPNKLGAVPSEQDQIDQGIMIFDGKSPGEEFQNTPSLWHQNPWWAAYQFENTDIRDRIITNASLRYDVTDFLYIQGRAGMDWWSSRRTNLTPQGTGYQRGGSMQEIETQARETNLEWMVGYHEDFGNIGVNAFVGGNRMRTDWERIQANGNGFNVPFFQAINNANQRNFGYGFSQSGINSIFSSAEVSWNNYLFVTGTYRRDWFSQLDPNSNSIDYPSIGASFVFSDAFSSMPEWFSFGKIRASWGEVGNANSVGAYQTRLTYSLGNSHLGSPTAGFSSGANLPNRQLVPFTSSEFEVGFDIRFFDGRLGLDFTYYDQETSDDIVNASVSRTSGFNTTTVNLGKLTNKGIEVLLTGTPVQGALRWDVSLNFAKNDNEVVSLIEGQSELFVEETRTRFAGVFHIVGQPYGMIKGQTQKRSPDGQLVFDADGSPVTTGEYQIIGSGVPDFTGGLNNEFSWKNFRLGALIDFKSGGDIYSGTNLRLAQSGHTTETLAGRAGEAPLMINGVVETAPGVFEPVNRQLTGGEVSRFWSRTGENDQEHWIYDASFVKLRQVVLSYELPNSLISRTPLQGVSISFVGRNLAILARSVPNIDPEASYTSSNAQGLDYFGMPATRSYGFNLNVKF